MLSADKVTSKKNSLANKIALWFLAIMLILFGLIMFISSKLGATFIVVAGVLFLPPIFNALRAKLEKKPPLGKPIVLGIVIFVFFITGVNLIFNQQEADDLQRKQEKIAEWQENKQKIIGEFDRYLSSNDVPKASEILSKYKYLVKGDKDIQAMTDKINEVDYAKKKKASGPSDINDLLLPRNWPIWGVDGKKYYRNFVDNSKDAASFDLGSYYKRYQLTYAGDGTIVGLYGQPSTTKSHREIRERMAELCGLDVDQIQVVEGGGFYNAEFSGKYAKCTYGFEKNSNTLDLTFSRE